jgi:hypothetical protein
MGTYYAAVEAFDPNGAAEMQDEMDYGGEARFFVLEADNLSQALAVLSNSVQANGLRLDRVLFAGDAEDFDEDVVPFEVDMDEMVAAAKESGEICVSEAHAFEPDETDGTLSGVYACCIDAFDPEWADEDEDEYAGHYQLVVIKAESASEALQMLVEELAAEDISLLSVEGLVDAAAFPFDAYEFTFEEEDPVSEALDAGGMILSNAYAYPPEEAEEPRRLDS